MARLGEPGNNGGAAVCSKWAANPSDPRWCDCGMPTLWHKEFNTEPEWERVLRESYYNARYDTLTQEERGGLKQKILWDTFQHAVDRQRIRRRHRQWAFPPKP